MAQQRQDRRGEVQAATASATGLACFIFRFLRRPRYGRILGQVYAPDGMNINQFMVRAGAAWVYEQYNTDPVLPVLQNEARQQKRGLWSDADPVPPWIWRHRK